MASTKEFLHVNGNKIYTERGAEIRLRGFRLGSWLNLEAFMVGFSATETEFRRAMD